MTELNDAMVEAAARAMLLDRKPKHPSLNDDDRYWKTHGSREVYLRAARVGDCLLLDKCSRSSHKPAPTGRRYRWARWAVALLFGFLAQESAKAPGVLNGASEEITELNFSALWNPAGIDRFMAVVRNPLQLQGACKYEKYSAWKAKYPNSQTFIAVGITPNTSTDSNQECAENRKPSDGSSHSSALIFALIAGGLGVFFGLVIGARRAGSRR